MRWFLALLALVVAGCNQSAAPKNLTATSPRQLSAETESCVVAFCSDCHTMPEPSSFPKSAWEHEVQRGYDFYYASGKNNLTVPVFADAYHYFSSRAPETLDLAKPQPVSEPWVQRFQQYRIEIPGINSCAISFIDVVELDAPLGRGILFSEMGRGGVYFAAVDSEGRAAVPKCLATVSNPAVVRVTDWDKDGKKDLMVADLGSFLPEDHQRGRVVWLRQRADAPGEFTATNVFEGVGRVSSVEVVDIDADGSMDLLVAEFGWQDTGSIFWLQNSPSDDFVSGLKKHTIDQRSGVIHVPPVDCDGDGDIDFIALISQHHEQIVAMINDGTGRFEERSVFAASEPAFGSSGIELVDMNGDGRLDVLYTNGDSFDSFILKPSHGVRWLENRGQYPFEVHEVGKLPGVHRALVGDFDGDGTKEIAASAFFAKDVLRTQQLGETEGLVVWQRDASGEYRRHVLSRGDCTHAAMQVADLDGNGRDDLLVGEFRDGSNATNGAITVWLAK